MRQSHSKIKRNFKFSEPVGPSLLRRRWYFKISTLFYCFMIFFTDRRRNENPPFPDFSILLQYRRVQAETATVRC